MNYFETYSVISCNTLRTNIPQDGSVGSMKMHRSPATITDINITFNSSSIYYNIISMQIYYIVFYKFCYIIYISANT